jgi:hypothetical protein
MPRKRSEKRKYKHVTTGDYCTCAAYIAEAMCLRKAEYNGISGLPFKFWNVKPWDWTFKRQMLLANKLIKEFGEACVVKAINGPEFKKIFSLNNPSVKKILANYKLIVDSQQASIKPEVEVVKEEIVVRTKTFGKKTSLMKLRELDGKKEN